MAALPAAAMYPDAGSVLELHAFRTAHHVGRAEGMQLTCGDQERVHGAHISPAPKAKHALTRTLTRCVRRGRVCKLKRVGPSKVSIEVGPGSLGSTPRPCSCIGLMAFAGRAAACSRQAAGRVVEVGPCYLALHTRPLYQVTSPACRNEHGSGLTAASIFI